MRNSKLYKQVGFTLIELLVVMAIVGMLAGLVVTNFVGKGEDAKRDGAKAQIHALEQALDQHRLDTGKYPRTLEGLITNTTSNSTWNGPYLRKGLPNDPWGKPYQYKQPGRNGRDFDLYSFGPDGTEGGEGKNADITNW